MVVCDSLKVQKFENTSLDETVSVSACIGFLVNIPYR
jgi:hypothetical protein